MKIIILIATVALACIARGAAPGVRSIEGSMIYGLLPAFDAEIAINDTGLVELDYSLISGNVSLSNGLVLNLDTLTDTLKLNLLALSVKGAVNIAKVRLTGQYTADVDINLLTGEQVAVVGAGNLDLTAEGVSLEVFVDLGLNLLTQIVSVKKLTLLPEVTSVAIIAEGATSNGEPIDTEALSAELPGLVNVYFLEHGAELTTGLIDVINPILAEHTLAQWLEIIGQEKKSRMVIQ